MAKMAVSVAEEGRASGVERHTDREGSWIRKQCGTNKEERVVIHRLWGPGNGAGLG